jgi:hypothetical protein
VDRRATVWSIDGSISLALRIPAATRSRKNSRCSRLAVSSKCGCRLICMNCLRVSGPDIERIQARSASAREARALRSKLGSSFAIVTPGVRPAGTGHADQRRVVTPAEAIAAGASHIVVGRPITEGRRSGPQRRRPFSNSSADSAKPKSACGKSISSHLHIPVFA